MQNQYSRTQLLLGAEAMEKLSMRCINEMVAAVGLSKTNFAKETGIPFRSIQNWSLGERTPPVYIRFLLAEHFRLL